MGASVTNARDEERAWIDAPPQVRRAAKDGAILGVASLGAFLAFLDATIVNVAFPDIRASFPDTGINGLSWVFNAYNVVFAAFLVASGRVADLLGRRRLFVGGIGIFTVASVLCGIAPSAETLIAARALQAVGSAILVPASLALVLGAFPAEKRAHAVGLWGASAALAAGLGPPLGGAIVEIEGWRSAFLINLPLGAGAIWFARRTLVESRAPGQRLVPDLRGSLLLALAVGLLTLGLVQGETWGWTDIAVIGSFVAGVVLTAIVYRRLGTHPSPVIDPALLRLRTFALGSTLTIVAGAGFYAYLLCHILFLTEIWDYSVLEAGLAVAPGALIAAVAAGVLGKLADKHDARLVLLPGALVWAGAYVWYVAIVGPEPAFLAEWLPGQVLSGLGVGATLPVLAAAASAVVPGGRYATAAAIVSSARQLGGVLGIALLVVILGTPTTPLAALDAFDRGWTFSAICFALVAAAIPFLGRAVAPQADEAHDAAASAVVELTEADAADEDAPKQAAPIQLLVDFPELVDHAETIEVLAGTDIFAQGDEPDALYVVVLGRLEVVKNGIVIQEIGHGGAVGELGLFSGAPRAATVRATRDSRLLRVAREDVQAALAHNPEAAVRLLGRLAAVVQASPVRAHARRGTPAIIGVVALGPGPAVARIAEALCRELAAFGSVIALEAADPTGLAQAEADHDRVVLVAPNGDEAWRTFVLRHADRLIALCPPSDPVIDQRAIGCELVFCDRVPDDATLGRLQSALQPRATTRIAGGSTDGLGRLARRLAGRSVGLVLSGGGARALAHIGVLEELEAHGIEIDRLGGVSMGALIAALHAKGLTASEIDAVCYEEFVRRSPVGDYTVPRHALFAGRRGRGMIERIYGTTRFEHLERDLTVVSADLYRRELVPMRSGPLFPALASTTLIPGLLPPLTHEGRVLVDGGVLDNLPVHTLSVRGEGPVIAVDVTERLEKPPHEGPPPLKDILVRAVTLGSSDTQEAARDAALVIRPDNNGTGVFEWHQIDEVREAGRRATRDALRGARAELFGAHSIASHT